MPIAADLIKSGKYFSLGNGARVESVPRWEKIQWVALFFFFFKLQI